MRCMDGSSILDFQLFAVMYPQKSLNLTASVKHRLPPIPSNRQPLQFKWNGCGLRRNPIQKSVEITYMVVPNVQDER